jgi:hypothetical protein
MAAIAELVYEYLPESYCQRPSNEDAEEDPRLLHSTFANRDRPVFSKTCLPQSLQLRNALRDHDNFLRLGGRGKKTSKDPPRCDLDKKTFFFRVSGAGAPRTSAYRPLDEAEFMPDVCRMDQGTRLRMPSTLELKSTDYEMDERIGRVALRAQSYADIIYSTATAIVEKLDEIHLPTEAKKMVADIHLLMRKASTCHSHGILWGTRAIMNSVLRRRHAVLTEALKHMKFSWTTFTQLRAIPVLGADQLFNGQILEVDDDFKEKMGTDKIQVVKVLPSSNQSFHKGSTEKPSTSQQPFPASAGTKRRPQKSGSSRGRGGFKGKPSYRPQNKNRKDKSPYGAKSPKQH